MGQGKFCRQKSLGAIVACLRHVIRVMVTKHIVSYKVLMYP